MATGSEQRALRGRGRGGRRKAGAHAASGRAGGGRRVASAADRRVEAFVAELGDHAESVGIQVRREKLLREVGYHARSGFCRVEGKPVLFLDSESPGESRVELLLDVLSERDLSDAEVSDDARELLDKARRRTPDAAAREASAPPAETAV